MSVPPFDASGPGGVRVLLVDYLKVLYRRRWLAIAVFLAAAAGVAAYTFTRVPLYQAQVSVLIDFQEPNVVNFQQVLNESPMFANYTQTQQELLQSRALLQRTVDAMQLWKRPEFDASTEADAINKMRGGLQIVPIRATRMVSIRFRSTDPKLAAEIANTHARQYVAESLEKRFRASKEATAWLDAQLAEEQKKVDAAESALQAFRKDHDALSLEDGQNIVVQKLGDLNAALTKAKTSRIEKEALYRELMAGQQDRSTLEAFPAILSNSFIQQLKGNVATLQRETAQLSETLGDLHPTLVEKRTALETAEKRLAAEVTRVVDSVRRDYQAALAEEQSLTRALDEQKREAMALNGQGIEYAALKREADSERQVYQTLLQRAKETGVSGELRATNVQIIDSALPPREPVFPRTNLFLLMGTLASALLAVGAAFLVEVADDRIKTPADVNGQLGQACLGLVPEVRPNGNARVSLLQDDVPAILVESFRTLRTSVLSMMPAEASFSILVASTSEGEGKTHVASNLAISLARAQRRVLLIDADMRRPNVHTHFDSQLEPGLSNVLAGTATLRDAMRPGPVPGLTLLSAGAPEAQAPELLGATVFAELLTVLQEHFSCVIIDSPPTLAVTDAVLLARQVTGVVFVAGSDMTRGRAARLAIEQLRHGGARMLGTVLNRADIEHHPFYFSPYAPGEYLHSLEATAVASPQILAESAR